ncbi:MAG: ABC transporter permease, partial [Chloroflexota bacterium]
MYRYVLRRLIQAIPTLFGITLLSYMMMGLSGNPVAALTFRPGVTPEERERLAIQLGVNDPLPIQYLRWLTGDDWMRRDTDGDGIADTAILIGLDVDGDGEPEPPGMRQGILRGDFGNSFTQRSKGAMQVLFERIPASLELNVVALTVGIVVGIPIGILSAVWRGGWFDNVSRVSAVAFDAIPGFWFGLLLILTFGIGLKWVE